MKKSTTEEPIIPPEAYRQAVLNDAIIILRETRHYGHTISITDGLFYCSDCEVEFYE